MCLKFINTFFGGENVSQIYKWEGSNLRYFVAILRFVAIYAFYKAFIEL